MINLSARSYDIHSSTAAFRFCIDENNMTTRIDANDNTMHMFCSTNLLQLNLFSLLIVIYSILKAICESASQTIIVSD